MILDGNGSDEILGGYQQHINAHNKNFLDYNSQPVQGLNINYHTEILSKNYKSLIEYFPENTKEGFKTEALPSIWENKDEFNALMQKASDDMIKLAKAIDTAEDLRAVQKDLMWNNCSACHNRFRAEH